MSDKDPRGTDKTFYQLMQLSGSAVLKLFGIPAEQAEHYIFRATVVKQVTLQPDIEGILFYENTEYGRAYIEFQGYLDKLIRQRLVANIAVSCLQTQYTQAVTAAIIYTDAEYKTEALDLCQVNGVSFIKLHEIVLSKYTEADLIKVDPKLLVLAPFTLKNPQRQTLESLQPKAEQWKKALADAYSPQAYLDAVYLISLFLLNRCKKLNYQEIHNMFHIDLMETQAGQDIFSMGEHRGMEKGIEKGIEEGMEKGEIQMACKMLLNSLTIKFAQVPEETQQRIQSINSVGILEQLFNQMMQCHNLEEFEAFLSQLH